MAAVHSTGRERPRAEGSSVSDKASDDSGIEQRAEAEIDVAWPLPGVVVPTVLKVTRAHSITGAIIV